MDEITRKDFENLDNFLNEVIRPIFRYAKLSSNAMTSLYNEPATNFKGKLSSADLFKGTDYEYSGNWSFLHFTNLFALKSILECGYLRMSEFSNLIDTNELHYAITQIEKRTIKSKLEQGFGFQKKNLFCLSMCESNDKTKTSDYMWDKYADKGNGVLIEFKFTKLNPCNFAFGTVQYGEKGLKMINELLDLTEEFAIKNPDFFPNNFIELFMDVFSFHKEECYKEENEVRMLLHTEHLEFEKYRLKSINEDLNKNHEVKLFNKLFLKGRHPYIVDPQSLSSDINDVLDDYPQIEIKNIVFGRELSVEKKIGLHEFFCKIKKEFGYEYEISQLSINKEIIAMYPPC